MGKRLSDLWIIGITVLAPWIMSCSNDTPITAQEELAPIYDRDISSGIVTSLKNGTLTEEQLLGYFSANQNMLSENITQAESRHGVHGLPELVSKLFPKYLEDRDAIVQSFADYPAMRDDIIGEFTHLLGSNIPEVHIVPALGLYANGGWASGRMVVLALDNVHPGSVLCGPSLGCEFFKGDV